MSTINSANSSAVLGLFGSTATSTSTSSIDLLTLAVSGAVVTPDTTVKNPLPTAPWTRGATAPQASDLVTLALQGRKFIDESAAKLDVKGASDDYKKMFALYQGINALSGLADRYNTDGVTTAEQTKLSSVFGSGLAQVTAYLSGLKLDQLRLSQGPSMSTDKTTVGVKKATDTYSAGVIFKGDAAAEVPAFAGDVKFDIGVTKLGGAASTVGIDLSQMGATPRTMSNVVSFINGQLKGAGVVTRFAAISSPVAAVTTTVGGATMTLEPASTQWSLNVVGDVSEKVSFSAPSTAPAVYLTQQVGGKTTTDSKGVTTTTPTGVPQLLKFQGGDLPVGSSGPVAKPGDANWVDGQVFAKSLGDKVDAARASATGADGSVYVLIDAEGKVDGQTIQGDRDVVLQKYDPAGNLLYSRSLGAANSASGYTLAVSSDGKVAVAGSVTGGLQGVTEGASNSTAASGLPDSFVSLYDAKGDEVWTQRRGAEAEDQVNSVAFGADGTVYVAGQTKSAVANVAYGAGGWDGYLQAYGTDAKGVATMKFSTQFGTAGDEKPASIAISGSDMVVAGVENGHAVLRQYALQATGAPTLTTTRDLGSLGGGSIAGMTIDGGNVIVAGATRNGALDAGAITTAYSGGTDAFVAKLSLGLASDPSDRLTYYGGAGDDGATAVTVANGKVWIAGSTTTPPPGAATPLGGKDSHDGYIAQIDPTTGAVGWTRQFTAQEGEAAPTSIAVAANGASVLDRLGLPSGTLVKGTLTPAVDTLLTSATSVRAGDQFMIRTREGATPTAVTIAADDTLATLMTKVQRAAGFRAKVSIVNDSATNTSRLQIEPLSQNSPVEILAGPKGKNALGAIGLTAGVITVSTVSKNFDVKPVYGLDLSSNLVLNSKTTASAAKTYLESALLVIRTAYKDLDAKLNPKPAAAAATGPVPAYLTKQLANYQAGLDRLTGVTTA